MSTKTAENQTQIQLKTPERSYLKKATDFGTPEGDAYIQQLKSAEKNEAKEKQGEYSPNNVQQQQQQPEQQEGKLNKENDLEEPIRRTSMHVEQTISHTMTELHSLQNELNDKMEQQRVALNSHLMSEREYKQNISLLKEEFAKKEEELQLQVVEAKTELQMVNSLNLKLRKFIWN